MVDLFFCHTAPQAKVASERTPFASLTPAPPTVWLVRRANGQPAGPCPCPGVDTPLRGNFRLRRFTQMNNCTNFDVMNKIYAYLYYQSHRMQYLLL